MIHDPAKLRLGRKPPRVDSRTLKLARYIKPGVLPAPPKVIDNGTKVAAWGMLANDTLGDCTCAGVLHMIMLWSAFWGTPRRFANADAVKLYETLCGYIPGKPDTDQGGVELDILNAWRKTPIDGCALTAYVAVDPKNWLQVKTALYLFGSLYMGLSLPVSAQDENVWSDTGDELGGWGGHAVIASAYDDRANCANPSTLTCITWGEPKKMTRSWLATYCDELYAPLSPTWLSTAGKAPNGFDLAQLTTDLAGL